MLVPVRCFTCGSLIADKYEEYKGMLKSEGDQDKALDSLGIDRYCCRRMFMTTVETIKQIIPFYEATQRRKLEVEADMK